MNILNNLIDAKINTIHFNFNASNVDFSQDLIFLISKLNCELDLYRLTFHTTSSFKIDIKIGEQSIHSLNYSGDSLYIQSIFCMAKNEQHQHWVIELIDNGGRIDIFSDDAIFEKL